MSITKIFCQDKAISILQRALAAKKVPHAYIFTGLEGVGKFATAREWAKVLLCKEPVKQNDFTDSCGQCQSCRSLEADSHPDFNHIYKELREFTSKGKGKPAPVEMPIDVIREFLIAKVSSMPALSKRKIFIISEAEKLNAASQNALLKVLEEPPEYCSIILICTRIEKLLPTTRSRCQTIRFGLISEEQIIKHLEQMGIAQANAKYFARFGQGSLGRPCNWAKLESAGANLYEIKKELIKSLATYKFEDSLDLTQQFLDKSKKIATAWDKMDNATSKTDINRRAQKILVQIIISALHDAMVMDIAEANKIINFDQKENIQLLAKRLTTEQAAEKINDAYESIRWIDASVNEKLVFEHLLLNLADCDRMKVS